MTLRKLNVILHATLAIGLLFQDQFAIAENITIKIAYRCEASDILKVKPIVESIISESVPALAAINSEVAERLRYRLAHKKLQINCKHSEKIKKIGADAFEKDHLLGPSQIFINPDTISPSLESKYKILHELLHFAKVDNFSARAHNNINNVSTAQMDNVYSCAYVIYSAYSYCSLNYNSAYQTCASAHWP